MATAISSSFLVFLCSVSLFSYGFAYTAEQNDGLLDSHVVQINSLLPSPLCKRSSKGFRNRASLKVVHRHGPCSQLSDHKTNTPTHTQILNQDQARVDSLHSRTKNSNSGGFRDSKTAIPAKSGSSLGSGNYVVSIGIGTPTRQLSLIFDTGSDLTWTQCKPCSRYCYSQAQPTFDPAESTTYANISCSSVQCNQLVSGTGNIPSCSSSTCVYGIQYGDNSFSVGYFGKEKLTLTSSDSFDGFLFGCGQNNKGLFGGTAGLLGLGRDKISVVSQTASKYGRVFSYCLPTTSSSIGYLNFGKGVNPIKSTPLLRNSQNPSFYFFQIIDISVGGQKLGISTSIFTKSGTIIDSGTIITRLPPTVYSSLKAAFQKSMSNYPLTNALSILDTCYDLSSYSTVTIPKIGFYFGGGAYVDVNSAGILYISKLSQACLAFAGNDFDDDLAIFGNRQQLGLDIIYDDVAGQLGFGIGGCK